MARESRVRSGVFVSYSRQDGETFARDLRDELMAHGLPVWHDRARMLGGRDWWEQIKDALNHVEYMVLVMTPAAMWSEVVRKEWRYARQQGVCVCPVIAVDGLDIASLPRWMSSVHWYDLAHQREKFFNDLNTRAQVRRVPFMAEPLPADYVPRAEEFLQLKSLLLSADQQEPVAITAALRGAGGYGKTTLARAICNDDDIQNAFDDGILWVTLGEAPTYSVLLGKVNDLIETLSGERPAFEGLDAAATRLRELMADRDILLVIDDVWRSTDLKPFTTGGPRCARLVTTRRTDTLPVTARKVSVDQMQSAQAEALLASGLPERGDGVLRALALRLGEWPLLLKLANAWLRKRVLDGGQPVDAALNALDRALTARGVTAFDAADSAERDRAVAKTLELSLGELTSTDQQRMLELAVFEEDLDIPLAVLDRFWRFTGGLDDLDVEETCQRLFGESLLLGFSLADRFVRLHDAIRQWLLTKIVGAQLQELHRKLLLAYRSSSTAWPDVPDDGYIQSHLAQHLVLAGRPNELQALLLDLNWLYCRLIAKPVGGHEPGNSDVLGLLDDFDRVALTADMDLVRRALRMSAHVLLVHPESISSQLFGRLGTVESPAIEQLCRQALEHRESNAFFPLRSPLIEPGPLVLTLAGHTDAVIGAALLTGNRQVLSWSEDGTLKLWDLARGNLRHELLGHKAMVNGATLLAGERTALSWSGDGTLKLWDLECGGMSIDFAGHRAGVIGATLLAEGNQALSWSEDCTLKLWDLVSGELLRDLLGHTAKVNGAALLANGRRALSWSDDGTLKLWDLARGELLHELTGHTKEVRGATVLPQDMQALSWSDDGVLILWNLERGELLHTLVGHTNDVIGATLLADGQQVLSWSLDGTLKLWDLRSCEPLHDLSGHAEGVWGAVLLAEERQVLSWSWDGTLRLWDLQRGELLHELAGHEKMVYGAMVLAKGSQALSWSIDSGIKLWDLERGELLQDLVGHTNVVYGATLLAESRQVLSWSREGTLKLWKLERGAQSLGPAVLADEAYQSPILVEGRQLVSLSSGETLKLWDLERGELMQELVGHTSLVIGAALLNDGQRALSWSQDGTLKLWDVASGELVHDMVHLAVGVDDAILIAQGRQALSWYWGGELKLWDLERGEVLHDLDGHTNQVNGVALRAEDRQALSWSWDGSLKLWDLDGGELLRDMHGHTASINGVKLVANCRQALSWSVDSSLKLWDLERGELLLDLAGHRNPVIGATLLAGGRQALSWSVDGRLKIWDLVCGEALHDLVGHREWVRGVTLLAQGRQALSWSMDRTLKLWDLERGELLHELTGHKNGVRGVMLLADGRQALSWSSDDPLKLWDLERGEMMYEMARHTDEVNSPILLAGGRQLLCWSKDGTLRLLDLATGRELDRYHTDYPIAGLRIGLNGSRVWLSDNSGRVHLLRLRLG